MALEAKDRPQSMQSWLKMLDHKHQIPNAVVKGRNAGIEIVNAVANIVNAGTKIVNAVVKGRNVEAKDPTVTPPPPVEDTHRKEYVYSRPTVEEETIRNKPARTFAWVLLTSLLLTYYFIGYLLTGFNAQFLLLAVVVALVTAVFVAVPAPDDNVALPVAVAWAVSGAAAVSGAVVVAWAVFAAGAVASTGKELRQSFSSVHTFLILTVTSNVGLGLGWIAYRLFKPVG